MAESAPTITPSSFSDYTFENCNVQIPDGSLASYREKWGMFKCFGAGEVSEENTIVVTEPGNLINQIDKEKVEEITTLKLVGTLNGTDLLTLNKCPNIHTLDISETTIISGGMPYYEKDNERFGTKDNTLGRMWSYNLPNLTWVKLPETLLTIGEYAFNGKNLLLEIEIPNTVTTIEPYAFTNCHGLQSVTIGKSVKSLGTGIFDGCNSIKTLKLDDGDSEVELKGKIFGNSKIESLHMGRNFTISPVDGETLDLTTIKSLTLGESVTDIPDGAFKDCVGLTSVSIPSSVSTIGEEAFRGCTNLETISIPDPVQAIGTRSFADCTSLRNVTLPGSLREVTDDAFENCPAIESVKVINPIPPVIEEHTFMSAPKAKVTVPEGSRDIYWIHPYWGQFASVETWGEDNEVFIDGGVTYQITSDSDRTVEVASVTMHARSVDVSIPETVEHDGTIYRVAGVANNGFENVPLSSVSLPSTIGYVGLDAFKGCSSLRKVVVCHAVTPPSAWANSFEETTYNTASLQVPESSVEAYKANDVWGRFNIGEVRILVSEIELDPSILLGREGETYAINAMVYPADAANRALHWISSDESVATVDQEGNVTLLRTGFCTVTARATDGSGVEAVCKVDISTAIGSIDPDDDSETLVYDLSGILVLKTRDNDFSDRLSPGVYIVCRGTTAKKITVN